MISGPGYENIHPNIGQNDAIRLCTLCLNFRISDLGGCTMAESISLPSGNPLMTLTHRTCNSSVIPPQTNSDFIVWQLNPPCGLLKFTVDQIVV